MFLVTVSHCLWTPSIWSFIFWKIQGHEDVDQYFSQIASFLSPHEFSTPDEVVDLLDSSTRPETEPEVLRKSAKRIRVTTQCYKLDEVACWQQWVSALGIRLLGLRNLARRVSATKKDILYCIFFLLCFSQKLIYIYNICIYIYI